MRGGVYYDVTEKEIPVESGGKEKMKGGSNTSPIKKGGLPQ